MKLLALLIFVAATAIMAQQPAPKPSAPTPAAAPKTVPAISAELKAQFFKSQLALKSAQEAYQQAQKTSMDSVNAINAACGADYQATMDGSGDPSCVAKPEPAEKPKK